MRTTEEKEASCSQKVNLCYQKAEEYAESMIDMVCIFGNSYGINSKADIEEADKARQDCLDKESHALIQCEQEYRLRLRLNCKIPDSDMAYLGTEKDQSIKTCLAKLYECK